MNAIIILIFIKELWEKINIVSIVAILGVFGTLITSFITWQTDRHRLKKLETDRDKMRSDFEQHKTDNIKTFEEIRDSIHASNQSVVDKVDELKMFLLHSKITLKGEEDEKE
jgi:nitrate/TMAO reductase-like tetraheme cytochrome c subunit